MATARKIRQPVKALSQTTEQVAAAAAADKARKIASRKALRTATKKADEPVVARPEPVVARPEPVVVDHSDRDAANALATAVADAATLGVPLAQMLADMGIDDCGRPLQADKRHYNGPMLALVSARKHYTKAGNGILCNGDELATICGAHSRDETVKALGTLLFSKGLTTAVNPYAALNPGQQSMNLRNKARHALKAGMITMSDVKAAYAA